MANMSRRILEDVAGDEDRNNDVDGAWDDQSEDLFSRVQDQCLFQRQLGPFVGTNYGRDHKTHSS